MAEVAVSIIIPVLNEVNTLGDLLSYLKLNSADWASIEVLVVDGGSTDGTAAIAENYQIPVIKTKKGRAVQMNAGAEAAKGALLYFLHADSYPPFHFDTHIKNALKKGIEAGCFRMQFDTHNWFLRFFGYLSRFNFLICRGGDQSLFISKENFIKTKGFNQRYVIYEDVEYIQRLYQQLNFKVLQKTIITSARKYEKIGWFTLQFHFGVIHLKYFLGQSPEELLTYYRNTIVK